MLHSALVARSTACRQEAQRSRQWTGGGDDGRWAAEDGGAAGAGTGPSCSRAACSSRASTAADKRSCPSSLVRIVRGREEEEEEEDEEDEQGEDEDEEEGDEKEVFLGLLSLY